MNLHAAITRYIMGSNNPDMIDYGRQLAEDEKTFDRYQWFIKYIIRVGRLRGKRVLDVGCGFGWQAALMSLLGDCEIVANDIRDTMTNVVDQRVAVLKNEGFPVKVASLLGDICSIGLAPESFDGMVTNNAIEHVHDLRRMFAVCYTLLRRGGRAVIINDNNGLNRGRLAAMEEYWKQRDESAEFVEQIRQQRPIEDKDSEPYAKTRGRIIRQARPSLDESTVRQLTSATAGMLADDITRLVNAHEAGRELPTPPKWMWCRNPITGEYCERLLDPYELMEMLREAGFGTVRVRHLLKKFPLSLLNNVNFPPLDRAIFQYRAVFMLVATKT